MNTETLFQKAIDHRHEHDCSAYPYEEADRLIQCVQEYQPQRILEIGTGIGYTTAVMAQVVPEAHITTLEKDLEHATMAREYLVQAQVNMQNIEIISELAEQYLGSLQSKFDFIFFDGYQIHYEFLPHYERLLNTGGILFLANNHLKSRTSDKFFTELHTSGNWEILNQFADTTIAKKV